MTTIPLRDRLYGDTGLPIQGATVQAYTITGGGTDAGTGSALAASTTTDVNGVWKFASLADPGAGNWYDVKIINGQQVRWRYGNIQADMSAIALAQTFTVTSGNVWDFANASLHISTKAATVTQGDIGLTAAGGTGRVFLGDGTFTRYLGEGPVQTKAGAYTVVLSDMRSLIVQTAAAAVTLCAANTVPSGSRIDIKSTINGASVARGSTDTIFYQSSGLTSVTLNVGDSIQCRSDGTSVWYVE